MDQFFEFAYSVVRRAERYLTVQNGDQDQDGVDGALTQMDYLLGYTRDICENVPEERTVQAQELFDVLINYSSRLRDLLQEDENGTASVFPITQHTKVDGKIFLLEDDLAELRFEGFTVNDIAKLYGVSKRTVTYRLADAGLNRKYSELSDVDLDRVIVDILNSFPNVGYRYINGQLKSGGLTVQRTRILASMRRLDPYGIANRFFHFVPRRIYSNAGPNALWHIDGNHKLVRWGFVIHGIIDGYSRMVISLVVATNNRASTVLQAFLVGAEAWGVPSRVRSDCGGENFGVARWMEHYMGPNRASIIMGPSVHNQRIERLWRDLGRVVIKLFRSIFIHMENMQILDMTSARDMMVLHLVFTERIQNKLNSFISFFNNHKLRTEGEKSPRQLFVLGCNQKGLKGFALEEILSVDNALPNADVDVAENFPQYLRNQVGHSRILSRCAIKSAVSLLKLSCVKEVWHPCKHAGSVDLDNASTVIFPWI
ncbi:uncharacterized protein LOC129597992 [Paramacrobiotus metropolitanus]|uniref:uncharacterized protein LOC129597992 n=1 Tax=Paramacrobiotus metropolitanus TaxID=2943436 RepID=UPI002445ED2B|nr:uncharacterized protein LOC129597992 [Paramacrobiotus metropolitanus]